MSYPGVIIVILLVGLGYAELSFTTVEVDKYGTAFLHCNVTGRGNMDFTWFHFSRRIGDIPEKYSRLKNGTLKVQYVNRRDVGRYRCRVAGHALTNQLFKLVIVAESIQSNAESDVTMSCQAEIPRIQNIQTIYKFFAIDSSHNEKILLMQNGKVVKNARFGSGRVNANKKALHINKIRKQDEGKYLCTVSWTSEYQKGHSEYLFNVKVNELHTTESTRPTKEGVKVEKKKSLDSKGSIVRDVWYMIMLTSILSLKLT